MQDKNYSQRYSMEQLTEMNARPPETEAKPEPQIPMVTITEKQWNDLTAAINLIYKRTNTMIEDTESLPAWVAKAAKEAVQIEIGKALSEQKEQTKKEIQKLTEAAEQQVGKAAERASEKINRQARRDDALWWIKLVLFGGILLAVVVLIWELTL